MQLRDTRKYLVLAILAAGAALGNAPACKAQAGNTGQQVGPIKLLKFSMASPRCHGRHCDLDVAATNALVPHPVANVPGDHLFVRVFRGTLADVTKPQAVRKGQCITYSPFRIPLDNSPGDGEVIFGAQMQSLLSDVALLSAPPSQVNTVVLVFETEPADDGYRHASILRLKNAADVQTYFKYAIEVTYTADPQTFSSWQGAYTERQMEKEEVAKLAENQQNPSGSLISRIGAKIEGWIAPPVLAKPDVPPAAMAPAPAPAPDLPAPFSNEIKVLPSSNCNTIQGYQAVSTVYTVISMIPVAEVHPAPCGE